MKKLSVVLISLLVFSFALSFANSALSPSNNEKAVVKANNSFAMNLYGKLNNERGNIFFSPFSIFDALSMTYVGARGETATQMANVLHITLARKDFNSGFSSLLKGIKSNAQKEEYKLNIANAIWYQKNFRFLKSFISTIENYYDSEAFGVNFSDSNTVDRINKWVSKETNGKINKIVGKIDPLTRLILTNAIYFKGEWASAFSTSTTRPSTFYVNPQQKIKVPMMYQEAKFNYVGNESLQAIEMPYEGKKLSMVVLLPKNKYGIKEIERSLDPSSLQDLISQMRMQKVKVYFPKFKLETSYDLKDVLTSMGMSDAFNNADFSGIDGARDLRISKVIHKAYIDVNEKGTEAAAVTAVVMVLTCSPNFKPPKIPIFRADHPFVFFIIDRSSDEILFMGRVMNPVQG